EHRRKGASLARLRHFLGGVKSLLANAHLEASALARWYCPSSCPSPTPPAGDYLPCARDHSPVVAPVGRPGTTRRSAVWSPANPTGGGPRHPSVGAHPGVPGRQLPPEAGPVGPLGPVSNA